MKKYLFNVPAIVITGHQVFEIIAKNENQARELIKNGEGEIIESELEVQDLDFDKMYLSEDPEEV